MWPDRYQPADDDRADDERRRRSSRASSGTSRLANTHAAMRRRDEPRHDELRRAPAARARQHGRQIGASRAPDVEARPDRAPAARQTTNRPFNVMYAEIADEDQDDQRLEVAAARSGSASCCRTPSPASSRSRTGSRRRSSRATRRAARCRSTSRGRRGRPTAGHAAPAMATAIASTHIRIRRQSPKFATSVIAPIVQKLTRWPTAPKTTASTKAPPVTSGRQVNRRPGIRKLWHAASGGSGRPGRRIDPVAAPRPFARPSRPLRRPPTQPSGRTEWATGSVIPFAIPRTQRPLSGQCALTLGALAAGRRRGARLRVPAAAVGQLGSARHRDVATTARCCPSTPADGRHWVVGTPGHEYSIRYCNTTPGRVLAVMSVDGVNVVSGDTAAPSQSGYVLSAYECADIQGWRKSLARTAAFYFTELPRRVRDAHRPAGERRRDRRRGVPRAAAARSAGAAVQGQAREPRTRAPTRRGESASGGARALRGGYRGERRVAARARRRGGTRSRRPPRNRCRCRRRWRSSAPVTAAARIRPTQMVRVRARERDAERDDRDPLRPPREPGRDGHPAAGRASRARAESVSRVAALRARSAATLTRADPRRRLRRAQRRLAYSRAMPAPALASRHRDADPATRT